MGMRHHEQGEGESIPSCGSLEAQRVQGMSHMAVAVVPTSPSMSSPSLSLRIMKGNQHTKGGGAALKTNKRQRYYGESLG